MSILDSRLLFPLLYKTGLTPQGLNGDRLVDMAGLAGNFRRCDDGLGIREAERLLMV